MSETKDVKETAKVAVIMGSSSDMPVMAKALDLLEKLGIPYEARILSAHRTPEELENYVRSLKPSGFKVVIAGAGKAAALPGQCVALTPLPVIGVPMKTSDLGGRDSLYSMVQMPTGAPVATVAINGAENAALLAVAILALCDDEVSWKLNKYRYDKANACLADDKVLREEGYAAFL